MKGRISISPIRKPWLVAGRRDHPATGDGHRFDWNDNNEYEVWDGEARCYGFGREIAIKHIRPVMPLLMMRASLEAQQRFAPQKRPYLISRSGCAGMQRYVQTGAATTEPTGIRCAITSAWARG